MKKFIGFLLLIGLFSPGLLSQQSTSVTNPSFRYQATPGFVNISEINGGSGSYYCDPAVSKYYFGLTNVFGYQFSRSFMGGIGLGYFQLDKGFYLPLYLENKYSFYLKSFTASAILDGGVLIDHSAPLDDSKIFLNPGAGISRTITPNLEISFSAGYMIQNRTTLSRVGFLNCKAGLIYRKNPFRMFKSGKN
ncbi:MAG TPA: hypothetical protein PLO24_09500 [Bacteroidales bacterium]|jgi:hypothetical protein|nr:hypothetical protein [Bacteroidales bacterium]HOS73081.1 hypothetical protein [Bacteroidales bacterium]HQH25369.1 hypothetical protein [Bacteroidales bacterium]HQJ82963.1 hypothetical protein [Bacteroidales bacterium]